MSTVLIAFQPGPSKTEGDEGERSWRDGGCNMESKVFSLHQRVTAGWACFLREKAGQIEPA
jgi:hypothetical protein